MTRETIKIFKMKKIILSVIAALFVAGTAVASFAQENPKGTTKSQPKDMKPQSKPFKSGTIKVSKAQPVSRTATVKKKALPN